MGLKSTKELLEGVVESGAEDPHEVEKLFRAYGAEGAIPPSHLTISHTGLHGAMIIKWRFQASMTVAPTTSPLQMESSPKSKPVI